MPCFFDAARRRHYTHAVHYYFEAADVFDVYCRCFAAMIAAAAYDDDAAAFVQRFFATFADAAMAP